MGLGQAFIELAVKGFQEVQATLRNVANQVKNTSATATINLGVSGGSQVQSQIAAIGKQAAAGFSLGNFTSTLKSVGDGIRETSRKLSNIGRTAAIAFAGASASIYKFVSLADPKGVDAFTVAVQTLGIQVGRIFVPLLHDATQAITQLRDWMKGMSDQTRENILTVVKLGLAFAALGTAIVPIARIATALGSVLSILGSVGTGVGVAVAGIVAAVGLIGVALTAAQGKAINFADIGSVVSAAWSGLQSIFAKVYSALQPLIATFKTALSSIGSAIAPGLAQVGKAIDSILTDSLKSVGSIFQDIGKFVLSVIPSANQMGKVFAGMTLYISAVGDVVRAVFGTLKTLVEAVTPAASVLVKMLIDGFTRLYPIYAKIQAKIMEFIAVVVRAGSRVIDAFKPVLDDLMPLFQSSFETAITVIEKVANMDLSYLVNGIKFATFVVERMVTVWVFVASQIKKTLDFLYGELDAFIDKANEAIDKLNNRPKPNLATSLFGGAGFAYAMFDKAVGNVDKLAKPQRKTLTIDEKYKPDPNKPDPNKIDPNKFRGEVRTKNEIVGLEDLFKRNLTQDRDDPQLAVLKEQRDESRNNGDVLKQIRDRLDGLNPGDVRR